MPPTLTRAQTMAMIDARTEGAGRGVSVTEFVERLRTAGVNPTEMLDGAPQHRVEQVAAGALARDNLLRTVPFTTRAAAADAEPNDGLTIEGYGAVFDSVTEINSWEGKFDEKIRKGAFRKTLSDQTPRMQFDHGNHPLLGGLPLGRWTSATEDTHGLHLVGRMFDNWIVQPFRDAIAEGAIDGMSFRFSVVREEWRDAQNKKINDDTELFELLYYGAGDRGPITRELIEVKCPEAGPVVWPAYSDTEVGARSADGGTLTIDLAVLRSDPRRLADVAALIDGEVCQSERGRVMSQLTARLDALNGYQRDDTIATEGVHTDPVHTGTAVAVAVGSTEHSTTEPLATERSADRHPAAVAAPPVADNSAGEHLVSDQSSGHRPVNPVDRRNVIRSEYRDVLNRTLALPES